MHHALRRSRRARGVENEQRVFRAHLLRRAVIGTPSGEIVMTRSRGLMHGAVAAGALDHHHLLVAERFGQGLVGVVLELDLPAAAQTLIGGDDELRLAVGDAARERVRREAAEHHGMDRPDARASEHGVGGFRDHRQIDGDAVAAA